MAGVEVYKPSQQHESPLGSLGHILHIAKVARIAEVITIDELKDFLTTYHVGESLAYFIAQNETPKRGESDHTIRLDTRLLHGYTPGPVIDATFNYHPANFSKNFVDIFGRGSADSDVAYSLKMWLDDTQELAKVPMLSAHVQKGGSRTLPKKLLSFHDYSYPEYKQNRPRVFMTALQMAADGLAKYVEARDNV